MTQIIDFHHKLFNNIKNYFGFNGRVFGIGPQVQLA